MSDTKTRSSSVVLDRNEWESLVADVRRLAQTYEHLLIRISGGRANLQGARGRRPPGQEKRSGASGVLGFLGLKQEPVTPRAPFPGTPARVCLYCGTNLDPADKFCRICGRKRAPQM